MGSSARSRVRGRRSVPQPWKVALTSFCMRATSAVSISSVFRRSRETSVSASTWTTSHSAGRPMLSRTRLATRAACSEALAASMVCPCVRRRCSIALMSAKLFFATASARATSSIATSALDARSSQPPSLARRCSRASASESFVALRRATKSPAALVAAELIVSRWCSAATACTATRRETSPSRRAVRNCPARRSASFAW
mmetsp:Transcript_91844/g.284056  ORF Transcript_91844/g.284056 Transcript_91844/m.284056 type:complete len:200 (-) Transcript_91844:569-1168(-)